MFVSDMSTAALHLGCLGLLWAAAYTALGRITPMSLVPIVLHTRIQRTRIAVPYVAGLALLLLVCGATTRI